MRELSWRRVEVLTLAMVASEIRGGEQRFRIPYSMSETPRLAPQSAHSQVLSAHIDSVD